jgi:hypothetical protein
LRPELATFHESWLAERVLVHFDDFVVAEWAQGEIVKARNVAAEDKRRGEQAPE